MKIVKKIAVEFTDGTKQIIFDAIDMSWFSRNGLKDIAFEKDALPIKPIEPKVETKIEPKVQPKVESKEWVPVVGYVVKIDPTKESHKGGYYTRHYFRDINNETYFLDVNKSSSNIFKKLQVGDTFEGLSVIVLNKKKYINGRSHANFIGKWSDIEKKLNPTKGFTI